MASVSNVTNLFVDIAPAPHQKRAQFCAQDILDYARNVRIFDLHFLKQKIPFFFTSRAFIF